VPKLSWPEKEKSRNPIAVSFFIKLLNCCVAPTAPAGLPRAGNSARRVADSNTLSVDSKRTLIDGNNIGKSRGNHRKSNGPAFRYNS